MPETNPQFKSFKKDAGSFVLAVVIQCVKPYIVSRKVLTRKKIIAKLTLPERPTATELFETVSNSASCQIVRGHFDAHAITDKNANAILAHFA